MKNFLLPVLLFGMLSVLHAQQKVKFAINDQLKPTDKALLQGFLADKLQAAYEHRIMAQDVDRLIDAFKTRTEDRCWQSEFWGKWFTSAVLAYRYNPQTKLKARIDSAVAGLLKTQSADGYIGNYSPQKRLEQWDIWGSKYCMLGLITYYDLTGNKKSLSAAAKLADNVIAELKKQQAMIVQKGNHRGMAASSILEPVTQLYVRTADQKYLAFAEKIVQEWESPQGPQLISKAGIDVAKRFPKPANWFGPEQGQKAYEMMSCYEGLLEMYRVTGKAAYRTAVEKAWENIRNTEINIVGSGSAMECWYGGKATQALITRHSEETCVTATWIKLSAQLLRLTGETKYADAIEQTYYNALLGSMTPDGSTWAKYTPIMGVKSGGEDQCHMGLNCCVASGPRALFLIPSIMVMGNKSGAYINFYNAGNYTFLSPKKQVVKIAEQTSYPQEGRVNIQLEMKKTENMTLSLRIPAWSNRSSLTINGEQLAVKPGEFIAIKRAWSSADKIELNLDMRARVEKTGQEQKFLALVRGPVVLSRDLRLTGAADVDETITPVLDKEGFAQLIPQKNKGKNSIWMNYTVPCLVGSYRAEESAKPVNLIFCDYASAGNTFSNESRYRIWFPQLIDPESR